MVVVKIVNEDVPVFEQQLYTQKVKEDIEIFTPLLSVKASTPGVDKVTGIYYYSYLFSTSTSTFTIFKIIPKFLIQKSVSNFRRCIFGREILFNKGCPI